MWLSMREFHNNTFHLGFTILRPSLRFNAPVCSTRMWNRVRQPIVFFKVIIAALFLLLPVWLETSRRCQETSNQYQVYQFQLLKSDTDFDRQQPVREFCSVPQSWRLRFGPEHFHWMTVCHLLPADRPLKTLLSALSLKQPGGHDVHDLNGSSDDLRSTEGGRASSPLFICGSDVTTGSRWWNILFFGSIFLNLQNQLLVRQQTQQSSARDEDQPRWIKSLAVSN